MRRLFLRQIESGAMCAGHTSPGRDGKFLTISAPDVATARKTPGGSKTYASSICDKAAKAPGKTKRKQYARYVDIPDMAYDEYARTLGLIGLRMDKPEDVSPVWDEALAADRPVVINAYTDPNVPPLATLKSAVAVLEEAGYQVHVPRQHLCCGRPLYDYGWVEKGKELWRDILKALADDIHAGTPIVGIEPSCTAAFRDELINLVPADWDAQRLSKQVFTLGEFLQDVAEGYEPPKLDRKAVFHGHCHHRSIMGIGPERKIMENMGVDYMIPRASCCGMAGAFGLEAEHYDVSVKVGEHEILPAVRPAEDEALVITDGFSCREQIEQLTGRHALHLAEVLDMAYRQNRNGQTDSREEGARLTSGRPWTAAAGAVAVAGLALYTWNGRR